MDKRTGEKTGWIAGWLGGFIWVLILSIMFLIQGKTAEGIAGLVLVCIAVVFVLWTAPWRHAGTPYWRLMLPVFAALFVSIVWAFWALGGAGELGLNWWNAFWILPILIPFKTAGKRTWEQKK